MNFSFSSMVVVVKSILILRYQNLHHVQCHSIHVHILFTLMRLIMNNLLPSRFYISFFLLSVAWNSDNLLSSTVSLKYLLRTCTPPPPSLNRKTLSVFHILFFFTCKISLYGLLKPNLSQQSSYFLVRSLGLIKLLLFLFAPKLETYKSSSSFMS